MESRKFLSLRAIGVKRSIEAGGVVAAALAWARASVLALLLLSLMCLMQAAQAAAPRDLEAACMAVKGLNLPGTTLTEAVAIHPTAEDRAPGTESPPTTPGAAQGEPVRLTRPYCRVTGVVQPAIRFEVWLPLVGWNGRFEGLGLGAFSGAVPYAGMAAAVAQGYAVGGTDTGHQSGFMDAGWTMKDGQFDAAVAADWAHRGIHEMSVQSQAVLAAVYGEPARHRYFVGCSSGGHQALTEAQRYPDDYDGILAGAPANYWTHLMAGQLWYGLATRVDPATNLEQPVDLLPRIHAAVLAACDRLDGVADGVLENPLACHFVPALLACKAGEAPGNCLTPAQVGALTKVYGNAVGRDGRKLFPGLAPGSEQGWPAMSRVQVGFAETYYRYFVFHDPQWQYATLDLDRDVARADASVGTFNNSVDADLTRFRRHGGKLLQYHGWSDPLISPYNSIDYYEAVLARSARSSRVAALADTQQFHRLFMVPGMGHCRGGEGTDNFDGLAALQSWVEQGRAPERIEATRQAEGKPLRSRPLCAYPKQAVYSGQGSSDESANFRCELAAANQDGRERSR
jgi:feruloyl esterase